MTVIASGQIQTTPAATAPRTSIGNLRPPPVVTPVKRPTSTAKYGTDPTKADLKALDKLMGQLTAADRKKISKALKRLTPEGRKQILEMMKHQVTGKQVPSQAGAARVLNVPPPLPPRLVF